MDDKTYEEIYNYLLNFKFPARLEKGNFKKPAAYKEARREFKTRVLEQYEMRGKFLFNKSKDRMVIPRAYVKYVFDLSHVSGVTHNNRDVPHHSFVVTASNLTQIFLWDGIKEDLLMFYKACRQCCKSATILDESAIQEVVRLADIEMPNVDIQGPVGNPLAEIPDIHGAVGNPLAEIPDIHGAVGNPLAEIPDIQREVDNPLAEIPDMQGAVGNPLADMSDIQGAVGNPMAEIPDIRGAVGNPLAEIQDKYAGIRMSLNLDKGELTDEQQLPKQLMEKAIESVKELLASLPRVGTVNSSAPFDGLLTRETTSSSVQQTHAKRATEQRTPNNDGTYMSSMTSSNANEPSSTASVGELVPRDSFRTDNEKKHFSSMVYIDNDCSERLPNENPDERVGQPYRIANAMDTSQTVFKQEYQIHTQDISTAGDKGCIPSEDENKTPIDDNKTLNGDENRATVNTNKPRIDNNIPTGEENKTLGDDNKIRSENENKTFNDGNKKSRDHEQTSESELEQPGGVEVLSTGDVEGEATGDIEVETVVQVEPTGDIECQATGDIEIQATGDIEGQATGDTEDKTTGDIEDKTTGDIEDKTTGDIEDKTTGDIEDKTTGDHVDQTTGDIEGHATGDIEIQATCDIDVQATGDIEGQATVYIEGQGTGDVEGKITRDVECETTGVEVEASVDMECDTSVDTNCETTGDFECEAAVDVEVKTTHVIDLAEDVKLCKSTLAEKISVSHADLQNRWNLFNQKSSADTNEEFEELDQYAEFVKRDVLERLKTYTRIMHCDNYIDKPENVERNLLFKTSCDDYVATVFPEQVVDDYMKDYRGHAIALPPSETTASAHRYHELWLDKDGELIQCGQTIEEVVSRHSVLTEIAKKTSKARSRSKISCMFDEDDLLAIRLQIVSQKARFWGRLFADVDYRDFNIHLQSPCAPMFKFFCCILTVMDTSIDKPQYLLTITDLFSYYTSARVVSDNTLLTCLESITRELVETFRMCAFGDKRLHQMELIFPRCQMQLGREFLRLGSNALHIDLHNVEYALIPHVLSGINYWRMYRGGFKWVNMAMEIIDEYNKTAALTQYARKDKLVTPDEIFSKYLNKIKAKVEQIE